MRVISQKPLKLFGERHPNAKASLAAWYRTARRGAFNNLAELRRTFGSVDYVNVQGKGVYVFNVGGNNYRIVAVIHFNGQRLYVRAMLNHAEYSTGAWRKQI